MTADRAAVPLAELHCHLEGTVLPDLLRKLAKRHGVSLPPGLVDTNGQYVWSDFLDFLRVYDLIAACIRSAEDYYEVTAAYLQRLAESGCVYAELTASPDHAYSQGLSYAGMVDGIARAITDARTHHGIEARIIVTAIRHYGAKAALGVAEAAARHPHPYVTGFGLAGDENCYAITEFTNAFWCAKDAGLGLTAHAGEHVGAAGVRTTLAELPVTRIGHGVRAVEDADCLAEIRDRGIVLEVCPCSNMALALYPDPAAHPLKSLHAAGIRVTLNSDDPPFFTAELADNYQFAQTWAGFDDAALNGVTKTAIEAAFVDEKTRTNLQERLSR